jgi:exodeoxyribonuclease V alpha subunit
VQIEQEYVLDPRQAEAIALCCDLSVSNRICAVTGAAGTGKTTILKQVYDKLEENGYRVALCSPTGKAAKRIRQATGLQASTIHMLLEYPYPGERDLKTGRPLEPTEPKRHRGNPLPFDVVLCDEAAMVNNELYRNLIDALRSGACIRFVGDINQLSPIENEKYYKDAPSPFSAIMKKYKVTVLDVLHRQGEGSGIVENAGYISKGRLPRRTEDFDYTVTNEPLDVLDRILTNDPDVNDWRDIDNQIITPTNIGWVGTHKLNAMLQHRFQFTTSRSAFIDLPRHVWQSRNEVSVALHDKVIWTENNYDLKIFNGESGIIVEIADNGEVVIDFGDRSEVIPPLVETTNKYGKLVTYDPRASIDLAYAITTHKSQGSEYNRVIYIMHSSRPFGLNRKNFYTGVTRARHSVQVICDQRALTLSMRSQ